MTSPTAMAWTELAAKGADADFIQQTLQFALPRLMDMDVETLCRAAYGKRSDERVNSRYGYRDRAWETRAGTVDLKIPSCVTAATSPAFWSHAAPPRRR